MQVRALEDWRKEVASTIPAASVAPVDTAEAEIPIDWDSVCKIFPYVFSDRERCHKVVVGYPNHPRDWKTQCGWPFGIAKVAELGDTLPACHKSICERCLLDEREAVKAAARSRLHEAGKTAPL